MQVVVLEVVYMVNVVFVVFVSELVVEVQVVIIVNVLLGEEYVSEKSEKSDNVLVVSVFVKEVYDEVLVVYFVVVKFVSFMVDIDEGKIVIVKLVVKLINMLFKVLQQLIKLKVYLIVKVVKN